MERLALLAIVSCFTSASCTPDDSLGALRGTFRESDGRTLLSLTDQKTGYIIMPGPLPGEQFGYCNTAVACRVGTCRIQSVSKGLPNWGCTKSCSGAKAGECGPDAFCGNLAGESQCASLRPPFPPVSVAVDPDAYGGFRLRVTDLSRFETADPNWLICTACRLVEDGKRIVCKGKQPDPGDFSPQTCEFERIEDAPFGGEPGVFPGTEIERRDSGVPTDAGFDTERPT